MSVLPFKGRLEEEGAAASQTQRSSWRAESPSRAASMILLGPGKGALRASEIRRTNLLEFASCCAWQQCSQAATSDGVRRLGHGRRGSPLSMTAATMAGRR